MIGGAHKEKYISAHQANGALVCFALVSNVNKK